MRYCKILKGIAGLATLVMFGQASAAAATPLTYDFIINTAPLIGHPAGPFSIMFAMTDGSGIGDANNTVTVTHVDFGGGVPFGSPSVWGGASGSLETSVSLTDSELVNLFGESFTAGAALQFTLTLTTNDDDGGVPDRLSIFILDSSGTRIPTLAPFGDYFVGADLHSTGPIFDAYGSDTTRAPTVGSPLSIGPPTVLFLTREVKTAERATLSALLSTGDREIDEELDEAIRRVDASLAPDLWADDLHLTGSGKRVFEEEQKAVHELTEIKHAPAALLSQLTDAARTFTRVDRALAQTAFDEARLAGGDVDDLARAQEDLDRGDNLAGLGKFDAAIERYEESWVHVQPAMLRDLNRDDRDNDEHGENEHDRP